jgi:hypothetical protein
MPKSKKLKNQDGIDKQVKGRKFGKKKTFEPKLETKKDLARKTKK